MKKIAILFIGLVLLVLVACTEEDTNTEETEKVVTPVEVAEVTQGDLVLEKRFYGSIQPESTTPVVSPFAGEVDTVEVEKGDQVEEEDVLAEITRADGRGTIEVEAADAGEITMLQAEEGSMVSNTEPFATIVNLDTLTIMVGVTGNNFSLFENGEEATITVAAVDEEITTNIGYVSPVPNEQGLYTVELTIDNPNKKIKPGMIAVVSVPEKRVEQTLIIPTSALVEQNAETYVYIIEDNKAVKKTVTVTEAQSDVTAVEGDLDAGEEVVTSGQLTLADGNQVTIMKEDQ
ncbi:efflux RND transporter periplasmic adaptor subunit [Radiobacillus sp. PE A8.2]|uniref:efflux RND transporter periplasmic adaptor subunit n=1 Tax=Radiobacillus sp. PE A8.2 TaxID=3380349 RepID=UPI00389082C7